MGFKYTAYGVTLDSAFSLRDLHPAHGEAKVEIRHRPVERSDLSPTSIVRHGVTAWFGRGPQGDTIRWPGIATLRAFEGCVLDVAPERDDLDPALLSAYITSEALGLVLHQRGLFLLHASAVTIGGGAVVVIGTPGAGKSTFAAACVVRGHTVLSDDLVALDVSHQSISVIPGAGYVKACPDTIEALGVNRAWCSPFAPNSPKLRIQSDGPRTADPVRLSQVVFVEPSDTFALTPRTPADTVMGFTRYFPCPAAALDLEAQRLRIQQCQQLCAQAPTWTFKRPPGFEGVARVIQWLEQESGRR